ncbi:bacterial Ig-like domain-containing protein [Bifidobacterium aesculapii]|uniref:bacterial Ig-like domain-containing protein n=1 Tax=Bifidobacterium aesculapii TaxID=1329411 RepID=UPI0006E3F992|nr:bacterial Ig-like domain-containing protein [Bifidobacterium aesculapii]
MIRSIFAGGIAAATLLSAGVLALPPSAQAAEPAGQAPAVVATGTAYHVDCQAAAGGDGTEAKPFNSFTAANAQAAKLQPGDQLLFKRGTTCTGENQTIDGVKNVKAALRLVDVKGTEAAPIVVGDYGDAQAAAPLLAGDGVADVVLLRDSEYITVQNLDITNTDEDTADYYKYMRRGITAENDNAGELRGIVIRNNSVHDIYGEKQKDLGGSSAIQLENYGRSIPVDGATKKKGSIKTDNSRKTRSWFNDVQIVNNTITNVNRSGINMSSDFRCREDEAWECGVTGSLRDQYPWTPNLNLYIAGNTLKKIGGDGIVVQMADGAVVEKNYLEDAASVSGQGSNAGIWNWNADNTLFQFNEVTNTQKTSGNNDGTAWDFDYGTRNTVFQYNYSHDNAGGAALVCACTDWYKQWSDNDGKNALRIGTATGGVFRYNLSVNDGVQASNAADATSSNQYRTIVLDGITDLNAYNNTVVLPKGDNVTFSSNAQNGGVTYNNNVIIAQDGTNLADQNKKINDDGFQINYGNNLYVGGDKAKWAKTDAGGNQHVALADYLTATGVDLGAVAKGDLSTLYGDKATGYAAAKGRAMATDGLPFTIENKYLDTALAGSSVDFPHGFSHATQTHGKQVKVSGWSAPAVGAFQGADTTETGKVGELAAGESKTIDVPGGATLQVSATTAGDAQLAAAVANDRGYTQTTSGEAGSKTLFVRTSSDSSKLTLTNTGKTGKITGISVRTVQDQLWDGSFESINHGKASQPWNGISPWAPANRDHSKNRDNYQTSRTNRYRSDLNQKNAVVTGERAARLGKTDGVSFTQIDQRNIPATPGKTYQLGFWATTGDSTDDKSTVTATVKYRKEGSGAGGSFSQYATELLDVSVDGKTAKAGEKLYVTGTFTVPEDAAADSALWLNIAQNDLKDGSFAYIDNVTLTEVPTPATGIKSIAVTQKPTKTTYSIGDELDAKGLEVTATLNDGKTRTLKASEYTLLGFDSSKAGTVTVTVKLNADGNLTATFDVKIRKAATDEPYTGVPIGETWYDTDGEPIQAHGGGFLQEQDADGKPVYYWVGEDKSHNSSNFKAVSLYTSTDLLNWTNLGSILTADSAKVKGAENGLTDVKLERPKLLKNSAGKYVLWAHWEDATGYASSQIAVATADKITGPYTFQGHWRPGAGADAKYRNWRSVGTKAGTITVSDADYAAVRAANPDVAVKDLGDKLKAKAITDDGFGTDSPEYGEGKYGYGSRDMTLYQEGDRAYLVDAENSTDMRIHRLADDLTDVAFTDATKTKETMTYRAFAGARLEAPALVKDQGTYYLIMSTQSGWYPNQARYYTTSNIEDPNGWSEQHLIGNNTTYYSQPTSIMTVTANGKNSYIYLGDRWVPSELGKSTYVWLPLTIDAAKKTATMQYMPGWNFDAKTGSIVPPSLDLVSQGKDVYANDPVPAGGQDAADAAATTANDGNVTLASFWDKNNKFYSQNKVPYTWTVDLGEKRDLNRVDLSFATVNGSESRYGYIIKGTNDAISSKADADKAGWKVLADKSNDKNNLVGFGSVSVSGHYRYVQIEVTSVTNDHNNNSTASWANGIVEVQVYANKKTDADKPNPPATDVPATDKVPTYTKFEPIADPGTGDKNYFQPLWYAKDSDTATTGKHIQAHGGQVVPVQENGKTVYYWYGEDRSSGYLNSHGVHVYRSEDGMNWVDKGIALRSIYYDGELTDDEYFVNLYGLKKSDGTIDTAKAKKIAYYLNTNTDEDGDGKKDVANAIFERPKVLYNAKTKKYVMWWHADGSPTVSSTSNYARSLAAVAVSDSPTGPFKMVGAYRLPNREDYKTGHSAAVPGGSRDMTVFQDDDGTAYVIYSSEENRTLYVAKLNDEYTNVVKTTKDTSKIKDIDLQYSESGEYPYTLADGDEGAPVSGKDFVIVKDRGMLEAPALFKTNGKYYIVTSGATGWAPNKQTYYTADSILGKWIRGIQADDRYENTNFQNLPEGADGLLSVGDTRGSTFGSQTASVFEYQPGKFIYIGDRWNAGKASSTYVWLPIVVNKTTGALTMQNPATQDPDTYGDGWDASYWEQTADNPLNLASLKVDGKDVPNFAGGTTSYTVDTGAWGKVPTVEAAASDATNTTVTVDVNIARAIVTVASKADPAKTRVYTVRFTASGESPAVADPWKTTSWGNAGAFAQGEGEGLFRIVDKSNTGAWTNKDNLSAIWQPAKLEVGGSIQTTIVSSQPGNNEDPRAGIIVRNDLSSAGQGKAHGYALLVAGKSGSFFQTDTDNNGYIDAESAKAAEAVTSTDTPLTIKLVRNSKTELEGFYKVPGSGADAEWKSLGKATLGDDAADKLDVGVFATANNGKGDYTAIFDGTAIATKPAPTVESIKVATAPSKVEYTVGESFSADGLKVVKVLSDGTEADVDAADYTLTAVSASGAAVDLSKPFADAAVGKVTVTVALKSDASKTAAFDLTVKAKPVTVTGVKVTAGPTTTEYTVGQTFAADGLTVVKTMSDGTTVPLTAADYTLTAVSASGAAVDLAKPFADAAVGKVTVTVALKSDASKTAAFDLTVKAKPAPTVESIKVAAKPTTTEYTVGDTFSADGLKVVKVLSDGTEAAVDAADYTLAAVDADGTVVDLAKPFALVGKVSVKVAFDGKTAKFDVTVKEADKADLNAEIAEAEKLTADKYTAESWAAFQAALTAAKKVAADKTATPKAVADALAALKAAQDALVVVKPAPTVESVKVAAAPQTVAYTYGDVFSADGLKVVAVLSGGTETTLKAGEYTLTAVDAAGASVDLSKPFAVVGKVTVTVALKADTTKTATFEVAVKPVASDADRADLAAAVAAAKKLNAGDYQSGWDAFEAALKSAEDVLADPASTKADLDASLAALEGAQGGLVKKGEGEKLETKPSDTKKPGAGLSKTGAAVSVVAGVAVLLLAAGAGVLLARRRNRLG